MELIHNFRDFGGYPTENGRRLKRGLLYRSGHLHRATGEDLATFSRLGIKTICDLRSVGERQREPDRVPDVEAVTFFNVPMRPIVEYHARSLKRLYSLMFGEERKRDYIAESYAAYRSYAVGYLPQMKAFFQHISNPEHLPVLIHCSAGKDRTGVLVGLIQQFLGVSFDAVMDDYLKTEELLGSYKEEIMARLKPLSYFGIPWRRMYMPLFDARRDYLLAAFEQVKEEFGAIQAWLRRGVGLPKDDEGALRELLLEA
jgi:protein-tyrosine phosphatase